MLPVKATPITLADYPYAVSPGEVAAARELVWRHATVNGVVRIVVDNTSEGGVSVHLVVGGEVVHNTGYVEGLDATHRWVRLVEAIVTEVLTVGYAVVVVDAGAARAQDRLHVPTDARVRVRWRVTDKLRREYAAFDAGDAAARTAGSEPVPIPDAHVFVASPPTDDGSLTSPVSRAAAPALMMDALLRTFAAGESHRAHPPLVVADDPARAAPKPAEEPFILADLDADGTVTCAARAEPAGGAVATRFATASAVAAGLNGDRAPAGDATLLPGWRTVELPPAKRLLPPPRVETDAAGLAVVLRELTLQIGRTMGVSMEFLYGTGGGSNVVAGVQASRHQLAVMVASLQGPLIDFLERVFAAASRDALGDAIFAAERAGAAGSAGEAKDAAADGGDLGRGGGRGGGGGGAGGDRVVVQFNNVPFVDFAAARDMFTAGVISEDHFRHAVLRLYRQPESAGAPPGAYTPTQLLLEPIVAPAEAEAAAAEAARIAAKASADSPKSPAAGKRKAGERAGTPAAKRKKPGKAPERVPQTSGDVDG